VGAAAPMRSREEVPVRTTGHAAGHTGHTQKAKEVEPMKLTHHSDGTISVKLPGGRVRLLPEHSPLLEVKQYPWRVNSAGMAVRSVYDSATKQKTKYFLHKLVMKPTAKQRVYALNGNFSDCVPWVATETGWSGNLSFEKNPADTNKTIHPELMRWLDEFHYEQPSNPQSRDNRVDALSVQFCNKFTRLRGDADDNAARRADVVNEFLDSAVMQLKRINGKSRDDFQDKDKFFHWLFSILRPICTRRSRQRGGVDNRYLPKGVQSFALDAQVNPDADSKEEVSVRMTKEAVDAQQAKEFEQGR